jgi:arabinan endo-1,5-alpha-L-arabinosidase
LFVKRENGIKSIAALLLSVIMIGSSCSKPDDGPGTVPPIDTVPVIQPAAFDINLLADTYESIAPLTSYTKWSVYNTHDPSIIKEGDWYYCYNTDVAYGAAARIGIMVRKSKDLVEWQYVGWAFNGLPASAVQYITSQGGTPVQGLWAPYIMKVGSEFRLYYSLAPTTGRTSVIGLATSNSPEGPWVDKGLVVTSMNAGPGTNAIDPSVVVTPAGDHWMVYGSSWDGLYELQLNPATGLALNSGDRGTRKVRRGITNGIINGNLEGPEIIYNADKNMYYLFVAYDWLATKYNVRVFRSVNPNGPFLDFNGVDVDNQADNGPMILAPYKFNNHQGWQGVSHCAVFKDNGQYYMAHQGRPVINPAFMVLHVRKIFWTADGWPVVSPERYAWEDNATVAKDSLTGQWEQIKFGYNVVPGFGNEQLYPDLQTSTDLTLDAAGTINNTAGSTWTYTAPWLQLNWSTGTTDKVFVQKGRDWENKKSTFIFTGLNTAGTSVWGKKK